MSVITLEINKVYSSHEKNSFKKGNTGDTTPLAQDYLVWANTELGNFMTHTWNSYVNEEIESL